MRYSIEGTFWQQGHPCFIMDIHLNDGLFNVIQQTLDLEYSTVKYSILQYNTVQYSTTEYITVQYSRLQYIRVQ